MGSFGVPSRLRKLDTKMSEIVEATVWQYLSTNYQTIDVIYKPAWAGFRFTPGIYKASTASFTIIFFFPRSLIACTVWDSSTSDSSCEVDVLISKLFEGGGNAYVVTRVYRNGVAVDFVEHFELEL